jgi:hypothetical protein
MRGRTVNLHSLHENNRLTTAINVPIGVGNSLRNTSFMLEIDPVGGASRRGKVGVELVRIKLRAKRAYYNFRCRLSVPARSNAQASNISSYFFV